MSKGYKEPFKQKVLDYYNSNDTITIMDCAKRFNVSRNSITKWLQNDACVNDVNGTDSTWRVNYLLFSTLKKVKEHEFVYIMGVHGTIVEKQVDVLLNTIKTLILMP